MLQPWCEKWKNKTFKEIRKFLKFIFEMLCSTFCCSYCCKWIDALLWIDQSNVILPYLQCCEGLIATDKDFMHWVILSVAPRAIRNSPQTRIPGYPGDPIYCAHTCRQPFSSTVEEFHSYHKRTLQDRSIFSPQIQAIGEWLWKVYVSLIWH